RSKVTVKRRLVQFKAHSDCFVGSEAVDVLLRHAANANGGAVSREQVVCVCQALLQSGALEAVGTRNRRQDAFEDSGSALYRSVVWQEQTLLRLLNLVELPLLEGVLQCSQSPTSDPSANLLPHRNPDLISNSLDRRILQAFRDSQEDNWLTSGLDCLDFLPDQQVAVLSRELPRCTPGQLLLFGSLVRHYGSRPPLLPSNMAAVYTAVAELLENGQLEKALEALQLCLKLLPPGCREELRRLLTFMAAAAEPRAPKLDKEVENRAAVMKAFSKAILHSRSFPKEKQDLILNFLLSNRQEVFKVTSHPVNPVCCCDQHIHKRFSGGKKCVGKGAAAPEALIGLSTKLGTQQALLELLSSINLDRSMAAKERRRLLRQFCSAHPEIFHQYFGDSAASQISANF
uniref:DEP domain-containing protein 7 n=1 Tax=Xiphophorus couchianus TaxID=32473 RepID=A0A3B5MGC2_9TELE